MSKFKIITDMDEVLCNITDKWIKRLAYNPVIKKHLTDIGHLDFINTTHALSRDDYMLPKWMKLHGNDEAMKLYKEIYFNDGKFYDDLYPTTYLKGLYQIQDVIESITVITHCGEDDRLPVNTSKRKWLLRFLKDFNVKANIILLPSAVSKSQSIVENGLVYDSFVDDNPDVIKDVAENTNSNSKEFLIPLYGYNKAIPELPYWAIHKNIDFKYFENI